jgi:hypothetical protein
LTENTAGLVQNGKSISKSYHEIIDPQKNKKENTETAEQVKKRLLDKFRKDFEGKGESEQ